jgi:hypothetical protein
MASYAELSDLATDATFQKRIRFALLRAAYDISNESTDTPNHIARKMWADQMLAGDANLDMGRLAIGVVLNPAIGAAGSSTTDADIQFQVNSMIPGLVE